MTSPNGVHHLAISDEAYTARTSMPDPPVKPAE